MDRFGGYRITGKIGEGPRATVFSAEKDRVVCAVKILKQGVLPESADHRERLLQVLKRLPSIEHTAVVKVLEAGEVDGRFYVAMELMQCATLARRLARDERLPERDVIMFSRQIAQALEAGRQAGFYYGDLTAENVFVVASNRVKVGDFAIKKYIEEVPKDADLHGRAETSDRPEGEEEWSSAEEALRTRSERIITSDLQRDLAAMGTLMLRMLGVAVPPQKPDESFEDYRDRLRNDRQVLALPSAGVNPHMVDVIRRLLSQDTFNSPGQIVVELASAMIFRRLGGGEEAASPSQETRISMPGEVPPEARPAPPAPEPVQAPQPNRFSDTVTAEAAGPAPPAGEATPMFVWHGDSRGEFFVLREGEELSLGRDPDVCHFVIPEGTISRKHCVLSKKDGEVWVTDAGSSNGTFVNEKRVHSLKLTSGDVVRIGSCRIAVAASFPKET